MNNSIKFQEHKGTNYFWVADILYTEIPSQRLNLIKQCFNSFQNFNVALMRYHLGNKNNKTVNRRATPTIQLS